MTTRSPSLRYRVPLHLSLVALATGLCIAGSVLWHDYRTVHEESARRAGEMGRLLARALAPDLALEDTWQAYRTLLPVVRDAAEGWLAPAFALVLDEQGNTRLTSDPTRFPLARPASVLGPDLVPLLALAPLLAEEGATLEREAFQYRLTPIRAGEPRRGMLLLAFDPQRLWPHFYESASRVLLTTGAILLVWLPVGWWLGRRLAEPLLELEACVARLAPDGEIGGETTAQPLTRGDELARLRARVDVVAAELATKRSLERQMVRTERQAALGRLVAGVAHEINNPLGGMMTAIAMFKRHGRDPKVAEKTVSLLERGLDQIRHIVSALLVEVRAEPRPLAPQDLEDIAELVAADVRRKQVRLVWSGELPGPLNLPAGPVRQVLMNLLLNAIQAVPEGGGIEVAVTVAPDRLTLLVRNDGEPIPEERLERLFEPFTESGWGGAGLGLWISDQAVRQLDGTIHALREEERTVFQVELPLAENLPRV